MTIIGPFSYCTVKYSVYRSYAVIGSTPLLGPQWLHMTFEYIMKTENHQIYKNNLSLLAKKRKKSKLLAGKNPVHESARIPTNKFLALLVSLL